ncbi:hypothetical protein LINPERHAP1_LOCUS27827 [Linum perenne]
MDLMEPFLGTTIATSDDGVSFPVFFSYEKVSCICYLCGYLGHFMSECPFTGLVYDELVQGSWMHLKVNPDEEESQGPQLSRPEAVRPQTGRGRGGLHHSVAAGLLSTLQRQWARGGRFGGVRHGGGINSGGPRPFLALPGPTTFIPHRPRLGPADSGPTPRSIRPLRSFNIALASNVAGGSTGASGPIGGLGGPSLGSPSTASSTGSGSAASGRRTRLISHDGPSIPSGSNLNPESRPGKRQIIESVGLDSIKMCSAPVANIGPSLGPEGHHSAPPAFKKPAQSMQLVLGQIDTLGKSPTTPLTTSAKRKLLGDFEKVVGSPSQFPTPNSASVQAAAELIVQSGDGLDMGSTEPITKEGFPASAFVPTSSATNFDPNALFISGSEEGESLNSSRVNINEEAEVASLDRPQMDR